MTATADDRHGSLAGANDGFEPQRARAPRVMAFMPDEQTLFTVVHSVETGRPALRAAWRAGAWPMFFLGPGASAGAHRGGLAGQQQPGPDQPAFSRGACFKSTHTYTRACWCKKHRQH